MRRALSAPLYWISENAGFKGDVVVEKVLAAKDPNGFNAYSGEYENLLSAGVIDPTKVVRSALQNAGSIASLLLTTEALIADLPEKKAAAPAAPDMGY